MTQRKRDLLRNLITPHKRDLIQQVLEKRSDYITFAFEQFYHEHNIHAAMRSIEGFGFQTVHIIDNSKKNEIDLTITKGADYWLTVHRYAYDQASPVRNTQDCFAALKQAGYLVVGAAPESGVAISDLPIDQKIALVFGNERIGLSAYAREQLDATVTIPMYGFTESFNVSAAVTVAAYEMRKKLEESGIDAGLTQEHKDALEMEWLMRLVRGSEYIE